MVVGGLRNTSGEQDEESSHLIAVARSSSHYLQDRWQYGWNLSRRQMKAAKASASPR